VQHTEFKSKRAHSGQRNKTKQEKTGEFDLRTAKLFAAYTFNTTGCLSQRVGGFCFALFRASQGDIGWIFCSPWVDFFMTLGELFMTLGELFKSGR
jgi:hypothetical protein